MPSKFGITFLKEEEYRGFTLKFVRNTEHISDLRVSVGIWYNGKNVGSNQLPTKKVALKWAKGSIDRALAKRRKR